MVVTITRLRQIRLVSVKLQITILSTVIWGLSAQTSPFLWLQIYLLWMTMHKKRSIVWQLDWLLYYGIGNSYINVKLTTVDIGLEFLSLYMLWYKFLICRCTSSKNVDSQNCWLAHTACSCIHVYANCITPGDNFYNIKYIAVVSDINLVTWKL